MVKSGFFVILVLFLAKVYGGPGLNEEEDDWAAKILLSLYFTNDINQVIEKLKRAECPLCDYVGMQFDHKGVHRRAPYIARRHFESCIKKKSNKPVLHSFILQEFKTLSQKKVE